MSWYVMPASYTAHIQPTLTNGTETTGYPVGNARTFPVNQKAKVTAGGSGTDIDFDRFGTNGQALNAIVIVGNNISTSTFSVSSDTVSNFASPTTLVAANSDYASDIFRVFAVTTTEQYLRYHHGATSGTYQFGFLSFGNAYTMTGPLIQGRGSDALPGNVERRTFKWRKITTTNAEAIVADAAKNYIWDSTNALLDGIGGGGGANPIAVIDDGGAAGSETVYYGRGRVSQRHWAANYAEVTVDMTLIRVGDFA